MIPAGLQSLMGGRQQSVPEDLNALLSAQRVLQQQASPTTPDGRPTIAAQTEQAIAAQTQQDALNQISPGGMPGMMPSDPFKDQLMKTLQMQAQQQMAQMGPQPPQEMAEGGIASLPAENMEELEYAQGGVIGFFDGGVSPEFGAESLAASLSDANTVSNSDLSKAIAEETARLDFLKRSKTREDVIKASQERLEALKSGKMPDTTPNESAAESARLSRQQAKETPRATGATRQMQAGSASAGGGGGLDSLMKGLVANYEADRKAQLALLGKGVGMDAPTIEAQNKLREDFRKRQGLTGLVGSAVEDVMRDQAARDEELRAEYEAGKGRRVPENWMTALAARARGQAGSFGEAVAKQDQQQRKEDLEFRKLMMASAAKRDEMKVAVQNMREAAADGDFKEFRKQQDKYQEAKLDRDKIDANVSQSLASGSRQMLSEERQRRENAASRALQREDMMQRSREGLLANINRDISIKMTELKHKLEKEHPGAMILKLAEMGGASPEDMEKARQIRAEIDYTVAKQVAPLEQQRKQVMSKLGYMDMDQWGKMSVK